MEPFFFSCALIMLFITMNIFFTLTSSTNSTTDEDALLNFKTSINLSNPNSNLITNWSTNTPICDWAGVSCGARHHRVTALNLSGLALWGNLSPHLGNLTFLQSLDISSNKFTGALPSELSKLRRLKGMNVGFNNLTGEIPSWLGALSQLQHLRLNNNKFSGRIPLIIFTNMSLLIEIDMSFNELSGSLPDDICGGGTTELRRLDMSENRLNGEIPARMFECTKLERLSLSVNGFSGKIPTGIGNLTMLRDLSINSNFLDEHPQRWVRWPDRTRPIAPSAVAAPGSEGRGAFERTRGMAGAKEMGETHAPISEKKKSKLKDSNSGGSRTWRRKSKSSTGFRWKRKFNFNLRIWFVDNILFRIVSIFEATVLVAKLCFFYLCCGCHF